MTLAVDVLAQAIREIDMDDLPAGTLAERYLIALHEAGYCVVRLDEHDQPAVEVQK